MYKYHILWYGIFIFCQLLNGKSVLHFIFVYLLYMYMLSYINIQKIQGQYNWSCFFHRQKTCNNRLSGRPFIWCPKEMTMSAIFWRAEGDNLHNNVTHKGLLLWLPTVYLYIVLYKEAYSTNVKSNFEVLNKTQKVFTVVFLLTFSLIGGSDYKLIYRHYATLYFVFCVDSSESELGILDLIQVNVLHCTCSSSGLQPQGGG